MLMSDIYRKLRGDNIYHYTLKDNVKTIIKHGKLYSKSNLEKMNIETFHMTNTLSRNLDKTLGLNNYVFFTFSDHHPLIYKQLINKIPVVPIIIDISVIDLPGVYITDKIANGSNVKRYTPKEALEKLFIRLCDGKRIEK